MQEFIQVVGHFFPGAVEEGLYGTSTIVLFSLLPFGCNCGGGFNHLLFIFVDRTFINEAILQDPELIRAMDRVYELIGNPRPCINYGSSVERNEVSLAPLPANGSRK